MLSPRAGFTLIEMLISVAAMGLVMVYALGTFTVNHNTYVVVDQVSEVHQNTMAMATLIERDIRNSGYLVPAQAAACGIDNTTTPDVLFLSDADVIRPADELPASLASQLIGADVATQPSTGLVSVGDIVVDEQPTYDTDATVGNDSDFRVGGGAILVDVANPLRGVACARVTAVNTATDQVTTDATLALNGTITNAVDLQLIPAHVYELNGTNLLRDGVILAKDVEDLQVAWFYDADDDGQVDAGEYHGVTSQLNLISGTLDGADLREIRVNFVVRTRLDDPRNPTAASTGQATENQAAAPGDDGKRRRVHTSTVRVRNLQES